MKIYTGNFANLKKYNQKGLFPISIAISARYFNGTLYRPLNPERSYMNDPEEEYTKKYVLKLSKLDANQVFKQLETLSKGKNVILLCHEGEEKFCHRHLVSRWLEKELKIQVKELGKMKREEQQMTLF